MILYTCKEQEPCRLQKGETMKDMTEQERQDTRKALLYELRLIFSNGEKAEYTREEILEKLDTIAMSNE